MTDAELSRYFSKGLLAFNQGKPSKENPYNFTSDKGYYWDDGWLHGKEQSLKHKKRRALKQRLRALK